MDAWLSGIVRKRSEVVQILYAMVAHGVRTGKVTSEDVHHISVTSEKVWGASAKFLPRCGFVKGEIIRGTTKKSKGHYLCQWVLNDYSVAKGILNQMASLLTGLPENNKGQLNLL